MHTLGLWEEPEENQGEHPHTRGSNRQPSIIQKQEAGDATADTKQLDLNFKTRYSAQRLAGLQKEAPTHLEEINPAGRTTLETPVIKNCRLLETTERTDASENLRKLSEKQQRFLLFSFGFF